MAISKRSNFGYSSNIPLQVGDRYYSQELGRDFHYLVDKLGLIFQDAQAAVSKLVAFGGVVTQVGGQDKLNITAGAGYAKYSVTTPNDYSGGLPPTTHSEDIEFQRINWPAITNFDISGTATLNGSAVNYIKMKFALTNGQSRNRAKKAGSYNFEVSPSYTLTVDTTAPTAYEVCLGEVVGTSGGTGYTISATNKEFIPLTPIGQNNFILTYNTNVTPPTIKAGTQFKIYHNNMWKQVSEPSDRTFAFSTDLFPAIGTSQIFYLYCKCPAMDGTGRYGCSTNAPTKDETKQGWYSSDGLVIARFYVDGSGHVLPGSICPYTTNLVAELYTTTTSAPSISGLDIIKDGLQWEMIAVMNINANAALYQYINGDTTLTDYYSVIGPGNGIGTYAANPTIYSTASATINGLVTLKQTVMLNSNKYNASSLASTNESGGITGNPAFMLNMAGDNNTTTRTNITQISWGLSAGSWVAGSDIRIYRRR